MKQTFAAFLFLAAAGAIAVAQQPLQPPVTTVPRPPIVELLYQAARARTDDEATKFLTQARTLLGQGADVRAVDSDGRNGLHWLSIASDDARRTRLGDSYGDLTEALIDAGAEVGRPDHYGVMPLDWQPLASNSAFVMVMQGQQAPRAATAPLGDEIATLLARLHATTARGDLSGTRSTLDAPLPSQTTLSIRLTGRVGSQSLAGDIVDAVVTAPVMAGDQVVISAGSTVRGTVLLARPAHDRFHQSQLYVHFGQVRPLGTTAPSAVRTRVRDVDNARERVVDGLIVGIPLPHSKLQKISWATSALGWIAPTSGTILEALATAFTRTYSREIEYRPGVEMTLVVDMPQSLVERPPSPRGWTAFRPTPALEEIVRGLPLRSTMTSGVEADVTNFVLLGSAAHIEAAFAEAGWVQASSQNLRSDVKTFVATLEQHRYKHAPMFVLRLDGKDPDYTFQKQNDTFARRHHIRLYKRDSLFDSQPVWAGTATHDIGIGVARDGTSWFHHIDEQIDRERTKVLNDLMFSGKGVAYAMVDRAGVPPKMRNGTGDNMFTDGRVAVVRLGAGGLLGAATAAEAQVRPEVAKRYFEEATTLCERDAGRLWGVSLCGPMVIVDQATGTRATSQPEPDGPPPRFPGLVDGPVSWGGLTWFSFPLYMLPENDADTRQQVMLHGLFHRIQPELGLVTEDGFNEHLDTLEGRVWMRLEWRALGRAIESSGSDRTEAIADALAFRRERRRRFPGAADNERREEIREGLASYTGIAAWANSPADARRAAASALAAGESQPALVGNFEAASGPAYGVLLDDLLPGWRRQVRGTSDLGDLLASATNRPPTTDVAAAAARYDGATLRAAEDTRDRAQQVRVAELRRRFVDGPVLTMPAQGSGTSDTTGSVGIPGVGTVLFREFTLSAQWGRLKANGGVLRAADGNTLSVPVTAPLEGAILQGDGWSVTLNAGWVVRPAARPGSFTIVREK